MNVISVVTGIGYGDAIRESIILDNLKKKVPGVNIRIIAYDNSYEFFKNKYETFKIRGYTFAGYNLRFQLISFLLLNFILPITWIVDVLRIKKAWKDFEPDFIISDFEPLGLILAKFWKKPCFTIFAYDPKSVSKFEKQYGLTFKQKLETWYLKFICSRKINLKTFVPNFFSNKENYGKYVFVNSIIRESKLENKGLSLKKLKLEKEPILIMMGGSSYGLTLSNKILKYLNEFDEHFIIFGYLTNFSRKNITAFEFQENFLPYLKICKGLITLAGNETLSEALKFKKPSLVFPIHDHIEQLTNLDSVRNYVMEGDIENIQDSVVKFIKEIPKLKNKIDKVNIKTGGENQIVDSILKIIKDKH